MFHVSIGLDGWNGIKKGHFMPHSAALVDILALDEDALAKRLSRSLTSDEQTGLMISYPGNSLWNYIEGKVSQFCPYLEPRRPGSVNRSRVKVYLDRCQNQKREN